MHKRLKSHADLVREEILREWRGADEPVDLNANVHIPAHFLAKILKSVGMNDGITEEELTSTWRSLAGDFIANHSTPHSFRNGHLILRVTQPTMRFHLEQMKPMLLSQLQEKIGKDKIKSLSFNLG